MNLGSSLLRTPNRRIAVIALVILALDQLTKALVVHYLKEPDSAKVIVPGFFKLVNWQNTGAAWSMFRDNNTILAIVALGALIFLFLSRRHFDYSTLLGQVAFGLIIGGIIGNLVDRVARQHVVDFLYFYLERRGGDTIGFPAFNVADSAICTGVALVFLLNWRSNPAAKPAEASVPK
jgi:signal peptidase II